MVRLRQVSTQRTFCSPGVRRARIVRRGERRRKGKEKADEKAEKNNRPSRNNTRSEAEELEWGSGKGGDQGQKKNRMEDERNQGGAKADAEPVLRREKRKLKVLLEETEQRQCTKNQRNYEDVLPSLGEMS